MSGSTTIERPAGERVERRVLGSYDCGVDGPTLLVQGGIHGNEPAGVRALQRVLRSLQSRAIAARGRFVAVAGNLRALEAGRRFLDRDLNRLWLASSVAHLLARDPALDRPEDREQRELLSLYEKFCADARGPLVFVDLHTSSAAGAPFTCLADTLANRNLAMALPVPLILGLEEAIDGAVMDYFTNRGLVSLAVEGGQHDAAATIDNLESSIWILLVEAGVLAREDVDLAPHRERLVAAARGLPPIVEIRHRQVLLPDDHFVMKPGFVSFQAVQKGDVLAHDRRGPIVATETGRVLLPLYQGLGDDGFFLAREVRPFWLTLARYLRHAHLHRIVHWLPGVTKSPDDPNVLVVDPRIARWFVVEIFHLLGFRRRRTIGGRLTFARRFTETASARLYDR